MTHKLKTYPNFFQVVEKGEKTFEVRKNDRNFKIGDNIILDEYDPIENMYSGRHIHATITYIMDDNNPFINLKDYVIFKCWD